MTEMMEVAGDRGDGDECGDGGCGGEPFSGAPRRFIFDSGMCFLNRVITGWVVCSGVLLCEVL